MASVTAWRVPQIDHLRAARALGRRTGICVFSWDHLSEQGVAADRARSRLPVERDAEARGDRVARHAGRSRSSSPARSATTSGSIAQPSRDRASFCRAVGLVSGAPDPALRLLGDDARSDASRASCCAGSRRSAGAPIRACGRRASWCARIRSGWTNGRASRSSGSATPRSTAATRSARTRRPTTSTRCSTATPSIGLVTSAFLEAAIVGRPVHTLLLPEFEMYQEGVQHFRYLLEVEGGLLKVTRSLPEHLAELADVLARPAERDEQNVRFVEAFVRPRGLDVPATPAFVAAVEEMAAAEPLAGRRARSLARGRAAARATAVAQSAQEGWLRPIAPRCHRSAQRRREGGEGGRSGRSRAPIGRSAWPTSSGCSSVAARIAGASRGPMRDSGISHGCRGMSGRRRAPLVRVRSCGSTSHG